MDILSPAFMTTYFSSFIPGMGEMVRSALEQDLRGARVLGLWDGLALFSCDRPLQQIRSLRYLNNTWLLIHHFERQAQSAPAAMMQHLLRHPDLVRVPRWATQGSRTFRVVASEENQTISIPRDLLSKMESFLGYRLQMAERRSGADMEIWFLQRSEGFGLAGLRLTRGQAGEKGLRKGELRPELAYLLCRLADLRREDVLLDPCAGSGAIPLEALSSFPCQQVIAGDIDEESVLRMRQRLGRWGAKVRVLPLDARAMTEIKSASIDRIITDPPWGMFEARGSGELEIFYREMLREFARALKPDGLAVVLMGQKEIFDRAVAAESLFSVLSRYDILVNGRKAAVICTQFSADPQG